MSKNRKRVIQPGAKSIAIRTKNKIGGRRSGTGTSAMSELDLVLALEKCRKRDRNKLLRAIAERLST